MPSSRPLRAACALAALALGAAGPGYALVQPTADWFNRIHVGGNAAVRFMDGEARSLYERNQGFSVFQAGVVLDVDIAKDISFWYDTSVLREGARTGFDQIFIRWDNLFRQPWLNAKIGRGFTPYGEDYLRWYQIDNPLASQTVSYTWSLDEGVILFGDILPGERLGYLASAQNGNGPLNYDENNEKTYCVKLWSKPLPWLYTSGSWLRLNKQGSTQPPSTARAEWWLSGFHIAPLGTTTAASGPSPSRVINGSAYEGDIKLLTSWIESWLSAGYLHVEDGGGTVYDRHIRYLTAELAGFLPKTGRKAYLVGRYSTVGTYSPTLGYRFAGSEIAANFIGNNSDPYSDYNYDQRELFRYTVGAGYRIHKNCVIKVEYSYEDTRLIESAKSAANLDLLGKRSFFISEIAVQF